MSRVRLSFERCKAKAEALVAAQGGVFGSRQICALLAVLVEGINQILENDHPLGGYVNADLLEIR